MYDYSKDSRFAGIEPFEKKIWLASPTMHGEELAYMTEAYETNWMSTAGANINEVEKEVARSRKRSAAGMPLRSRPVRRRFIWRSRLRESSCTDSPASGTARWKDARPSARI